jgi:putative MATE family efflux protein
MKISRLFEDKQFYKSLFAIALPIMFQNLVNSFVNTVDTVMIGRLGTVEIAAVGLGNQVFFLFNMILFGVCSGGAVFTAQFWGKKDIEGIRKTTGLCLILSLSIAALFTAACLAFPHNIIGLYSNDPEVIASGAAYLRTVALCFIPFAVSFVMTLIMRTIEKVKLSMTATFIALSINVGLNYLFIFGAGPIPAMGVVGAALATVMARLIEMIILVTASYTRRYALAGNFRELFGFNPVFVRRFFIIALPVILNELLWSFGITLQSVIVARTHTDAIAAFNIANTVSQLTWVIFIGLGNGAAVLIGKKIGEGDELASRDYAARITLFAPLAAAFIIPHSNLLDSSASFQRQRKRFLPHPCHVHHPDLCLSFPGFQYVDDNRRLPGGRRHRLQFRLRFTVHVDSRTPACGRRLISLPRGRRHNFPLPRDRRAAQGGNRLLAA